MIEQRAWARGRSWSRLGSQDGPVKIGRLLGIAWPVYAAATNYGSIRMIYELRVYRATPGQLPNLIARFRDHT